MELKRCPFCGGQTMLCRESYGMASIFSVICLACSYEFPAADVAPVRRGEWIPISDGDAAECSECGEYYDINTGMKGYQILKKINRYCSNCGARMDGGIKNERGLKWK